MDMVDKRWGTWRCVGGELSEILPAVGRSDFD